MLTSHPSSVHGVWDCRRRNLSFLTRILTAIDEDVDLPGFDAVEPAVDPRERLFRPHVLDEREVLQMANLKPHVLLG
jgi:hypothetical protein